MCCWLQGLWNGWAHEVLPRAKVLIPVHWIARPSHTRSQGIAHA